MQQYKLKLILKILYLVTQFKNICNRIFLKNKTKSELKIKIKGNLGIKNTNLSIYK